MIEFAYSEPHYWRHMYPIVQAISERREVDRNIPQVKIVDLNNPTQKSDWTVDLAVVAGWTDHDKVLCDRVVYVEHGAGQTYKGGTAQGYSGGPGLDKVVGFVVPGHEVGDRWRRAYRGVPICVAGSPKLDAFLTEDHYKPIRSPHSVVGITFHWNCGISQEAGSAFEVYRGKPLEALVTALRAQGFYVLGTSHPRAPEVMLEWDRLGVESTTSEYEIFRRCHMLIADNTSLLPEFMALDRPVVFLDHPKWRRDIDHGGRFWEWTRGGLSLSNPATAHMAWFRPYYEADPFADARREVVSEIYEYTDGKSAQRAADFIINLAQEVC